MDSVHRRQTRGRGQGEAGRADLPDLDTSVQLLEAVDTDVRPPLHALTIDQVLLAGASGASTGIWVDTGRYAQTTSLHDIAPSPRVLDRLHIARGFTVYQHYALIEKAVSQIDSSTVLLVVPAVDVPYRNSDEAEKDAHEMLLRVLAQLARVPRRYNIPVLVTRTGDDRFGESVAELAAETFTYRETRVGPRFEGDDHETLVYDVGNGWVQTTLAYWRQVLDARRPLYASVDADITADSTEV